MGRQPRPDCRRNPRPTATPRPTAQTPSTSARPTAPRTATTAAPAAAPRPSPVPQTRSSSTPRHGNTGTGFRFKTYAQAPTPRAPAPRAAAKPHRTPTSRYSRHTSALFRFDRQSCTRSHSTIFAQAQSIHPSAAAAAPSTSTFAGRPPGYPTRMINGIPHDWVPIAPGSTLGRWLPTRGVQSPAAAPSAIRKPPTAKPSPTPTPKPRSSPAAA